METVIDVIKNPDLRMYAWWAYNGCGYEHLWEDFDSFSSEYIDAKSQLDQLRPPNEEYSLFERFKFMVKHKINDESEAKKAIDTISQNYWRNYKLNCFVDSDVKSALSAINSKIKCGVVSNFMVKGGIEELLNIFGIDKYFHFVVSSINIGWRKPDRRIYDHAAELSKVPVEDILFVGDNYICDYEGPLKYGFNAVILDKSDTYKNIDRRIYKLSELVGLVF